MYLTQCSSGLAGYPAAGPKGDLLSDLPGPQKPVHGKDVGEKLLVHFEELSG